VGFHIGMSKKSGRLFDDQKQFLFVQALCIFHHALELT